MEQFRLFLAIILSCAIFLIWDLFFVKKPTEDVSPPEIQKEVHNIEQKPVTEAPPAAAKLPKKIAQSSVSIESFNPFSEIFIKSPLYTISISQFGAHINSYELHKYREAVETSAPLKQLVSQELTKGTLNTSFTEQSTNDFSNAIYLTDATQKTIDLKRFPQKLKFSWLSPQGLQIIKTYSFNPDTYVIQLSIEIINNSENSITNRLSLEMKRDFPVLKSRMGFLGPSMLIDGKIIEIAPKDIEESSSFSGKTKWTSLQDRYFITSIIPNTDDILTTRLKSNNNIIQNMISTPQFTIKPTQSESYSFDIYFGPKQLSELQKLKCDLEKAIDFGWFDILAKPCLWLMNLLYKYIPNYGVVIIILTIMIKIVLWPLGTKGYKSMGEMKKIQPLMAEIREKYKDDKQKMNQELMGLYKIYKINPLGGCLPMLIQLPVFIGLYRMLYGAIELRHAPFFLWINDLSAPDRLFNFNIAIPFMTPPYGIPVLTVIMGATMFLQQKMSPPPGDPSQAKIMMFMPIIFTFIFINFSSGLVLYWLINNILSIAQQHYITKKFA